MNQSIVHILKILTLESYIKNSFFKILLSKKNHVLKLNIAILKNSLFFAQGRKIYVQRGTYAKLRINICKATHVIQENREGSDPTPPPRRSLVNMV